MDRNFSLLFIPHNFKLLSQGLFSMKISLSLFSPVKFRIFCESVEVQCLRKWFVDVMTTGETLFR